MDSRTDIQKMRNVKFLKAQGEAIAVGIAEYFGLQARSLPKPIVTKVPEVKPVSKPKEEIGLSEKAIVVNGQNDVAAVWKLHLRTGYPISARSTVDTKIAKEIIVAGGGQKGLEKFADKFTDLSGKTWAETVANVEKYANK